MKFKNLLKHGLTWAITIAIFIALFSRIEFSRVVEAIKGIDIALFSLSLLISLVAHISLSPERYREILKVFGCSLSFSEAFLLIMGSLPIRGVLPLRAGELSKVAYLKKVRNLSYSQGVKSVLLGYAMSALSLIFFILIGLALYYVVPFQRIYIVPLFLILFILLAASWKVAIGRSFFYSLGFEGCKLFNTLLLFKALNIEVQYSIFLLFAPITFFVAYLPITFCGLGTRESAILLLFSGYAAADELLAGSLLVSFVNRLFPILLGLFFIKPFLNKLLAIDRTRSYP